MTEEDQGAADKRLLIVAPEFAQVLKVCSRDGSTTPSAVVGVSLLLLAIKRRTVERAQRT